MSGLTLYELAADFRQTADQLSDMELPVEVVADTLESLTLPFEQKALQVAMFSRNLNVTAEAIKAAIADMTKRKKTCESRETWLKDYLLLNMQRVGIPRIESPYLDLAIRNNPPKVVIFDERQIPEEYMRTPEQPEPVPDKDAIAKALKAGEAVPGCRLESGQRLEIK